MPIDSPVTAPAVTTVADAVLRLGTIQAFIEVTAPRGRFDGVACFNWIYSVATVSVLEALEDHFFEDDEFMTTLDVAFVNRYLDALRADATGSTADVPRAWQALFESRDEQRVTAIQFAVAGMNAHINFDLSSAVVAACRALGRDPDAGTQHADYQRINELLARNMRRVREHLQTRLEDWIDEQVLGQVDDVVGRWSIDHARDTAWINAQLLWALRDDSVGTRLSCTSLDRLVGLAGRALLVHV